MLGAALFLGPYFVAAAQTAESATAASPIPSAEVSFQFNRTGLPVPRFTLRIHENGTGTYQADQAEIPATQTSMRGQAAQHVERPINLTPDVVAKVFKAARMLNHFNVECASKAKNIADSGTKTLTYAGSDGSGSCVYNYSENKTVGTLTDIFLGVSSTLDEGRKLEFLHRYDRLGLDAEMNSFADEVKEGRALELGTILPTLTAIADDTAVIQRVRLRAAKMLEQVAADSR
ncbi:hypothetical protein RBB75_15660 [Tunturibacter empetritectus]|uniref:Uncharacterized protein n=1 Tax=Tunturiibacter empetritectus TaxID=3069691 RepID=A0AAU7ZBL5_9BACT